jgi:DNA repair protein RadA/Sms
MSAKKSKTQFVCQSCGTLYSKWQGRCSACNEWNSIVEELVVVAPAAHAHREQTKSAPVPVSAISSDDVSRWLFSGSEMNRVLGGGLVPGSVTLIAGEPGIGKSTLLLDLSLRFNHGPVLYVSGEESAAQIKMRADRIAPPNDNCYVYCETSIDSVLHHASTIEPRMIVIDSVQTMYTDSIDSPAGSVSQIRESAARLQLFAKNRNIAVFLIGHVTKDGYIAGPKLLEHMVDTVLYFEGDRHFGFRILRSVKNRFGSTAELGIFEMGQTGLREVIDPSELFISQRDEILSGISIGIVIEGLRPLLIEVQALVSPSPYGQPQRSATGFDGKRMSMLLAVLEKKAGFKLGNKDVFLNITGGVKVDDPSLDLAVVASIVSSYLDIPLDRNICFAGEVGLSGEIRPVSRLEHRINEAEKLSYQKIAISKYNFKQSDFKKNKMTFIPSGKLQDVFKHLFG